MAVYQFIWRFSVHRFLRLALSAVFTFAVLSCLVLSAPADLIGPH
jgi:hypothetical protein